MQKKNKTKTRPTFASSLLGAFLRVSELFISLEVGGHTSHLNAAIVALEIHFNENILRSRAAIMFS